MRILIRMMMMMMMILFTDDDDGDIGIISYLVVKCPGRDVEFLTDLKSRFAWVKGTYE